jgi:hypothetical protein
MGCIGTFIAFTAASGTAKIIEDPVFLSIRLAGKAFVNVASTMFVVKTLIILEKVNI